MRLLIAGRAGSNLYGLLVAKEIALTKAGRGTLYRSGKKERNRAKWAHKKYNGWILLERGRVDAVTAEVKSRTDERNQLFESFIGFLNRHFAEQLLTITIVYDPTEE